MSEKLGRPGNKMLEIWRRENLKHFQMGTGLFYNIGKELVKQGFPDEEFTAADQEYMVSVMSRAHAARGVKPAGHEEHGNKVHAVRMIWEATRLVPLNVFLSYAHITRGIEKIEFDFPTIETAVEEMAEVRTKLTVQCREIAQEYPDIVPEFLRFLELYLNSLNSTEIQELATARHSMTLKGLEGDEYADVAERISHSGSDIDDLVHNSQNNETLASIHPALTTETVATLFDF